MIEFACRLPPRFKIRGLKEKVLLRRASRPAAADILERTKQPYRSPDSRCFFPDGKPLAYVAELLTAEPREAGLFEPAPSAGSSRSAAAGRAIGFGDNMAFVGMLSTMLLHRQLRDGAAAGDALVREPATEAYV